VTIPSASSPSTRCERGPSNNRSLSGRTFLLALLLLSLSHVAAAGAQRKLRPGDRIPDFSCTGIDGKTYTRADYEDKVLVLLFVKPAQKHSTKAMRIAQRLASERDGAKPAVLAISTQPDAAEDFGKLAKQLPFTQPIALDPDRQAYGDFGIIVAPTTFIIDGQGVLRFALSHMPLNFERNLIAHVNLLAGRITEAQHAAVLDGGDPAISDEDVSANRNLALAGRLCEQGKPEVAIPILEKLVPDTKAGAKADARVAVLLGTCYVAVGKVDSAAKCLDPLATQTPAPPGLKLALARLEVRRGNDAKAKDHLIEGMKTAAENGPLLFELGRIHERTGEKDKALDCYRRALETIYGT
jgi:peroxiredoxin